MGSSKMQLKSSALIVTAEISDVESSDYVLDCGPTIYFDGSCALCSAEIRHYASREGGDRLDFVDVSVSDIDLGPGLSFDSAMRRFYVRRPDGALISGALAFVEVWDALPGWKWAARVARIRGVMPILEILYRGFLPIRPFISKLVGRFSAARANARNKHK